MLPNKAGSGALHAAQEVMGGWEHGGQADPSTAGFWGETRDTSARPASGTQATHAT